MISKVPDSNKRVGMKHSKIICGLMCLIIQTELPISPRLSLKYPRMIPIINRKDTQDKQHWSIGNASGLVDLSEQSSAQKSEENKENSLRTSVVVSRMSFRLVMNIVSVLVTYLHRIKIFNLYKNSIKLSQERNLIFLILTKTMQKIY